MTDHDAAAPAQRPTTRIGALLAGLGMAVAVLGFALTTVTTSPASADSHVCPEDGGWVKVDPPQPLTITVPEGMQLVSVCLKAGSAQQDLGPETITLDPPLDGPATYEVPEHSSEKDLSHYSYLLVEIPTTPPTTPTTPPTTPTTPPTTPTTPPTTPTTPPTTPTTPPTTTTTTPPPPPPDTNPPPPDTPGVPTRIPAGLSGGDGSAAVANPMTYEGGSTATTILGRILIGLGLALIGAGGVVGLQRMQRTRGGSHV